MVGTGGCGFTSFSWAYNVLHIVVHSGAQEGTCPHQSSFVLLRTYFSSTFWFWLTSTSMRDVDSLYANTKETWNSEKGPIWFEKKTKPPLTKYWWWCWWWHTRLWAWTTLFGAELRAPTALEESVLRIVSIILQLASKPLAWPYSQIPRKYISASKPKYVHLGSRKLVQTRFRFDKIGIVCWSKPSHKMVYRKHPRNNSSVVPALIMSS